mmetsp:Transcript_25627/g.53384  ORF Transcript_25627/g.53384 Transcript_25627/m.53384 type:complete len:218 (-) Transcript_25627:342-995(-)
MNAFLLNQLGHVLNGFNLGKKDNSQWGLSLFRRCRSVHLLLLHLLERPHEFARLFVFRTHMHRLGNMRRNLGPCVFHGGWILLDWLLIHCGIRFMGVIVGFFYGIVDFIGVCVTLEFDLLGQLWLLRVGQGHRIDLDNGTRCRRGRCVLNPFLPFGRDFFRPRGGKQTNAKGSLLNMLQEDSFHLCHQIPIARQTIGLVQNDIANRRQHGCEKWMGG